MTCARTRHMRQRDHRPNQQRRVRSLREANMSSAITAPGPSIALAMELLTWTISTLASAPTSTTALPTWTIRHGSWWPMIHGLTWPLLTKAATGTTATGTAIGGSTI